MVKIKEDCGVDEGLFYLYSYHLFAAGSILRQDAAEKLEKEI
jgi:hypothetical protein